jgi:8-oxo-dGTP pyrophosphatase MutT (NUDIX family)
MTVAPIRPAATSVVLRPAAHGFDVLMVRRHDKVAFMAGAFVFPGGRVDEADDVVGPVDADRWVRRFPDLAPPEEQIYRAAAARELWEEASVRIDTDDLVPLAHWVTPEIETRRFDTRFFVVRVPADQTAQHDERETTELRWLTPAAAIDSAARGEIMLPPPTWTTLKRLTRHSIIDSVLESVVRAPIVRVQPMLIRGEGPALLTLPGDPTYPTIEGWEIPEVTRFRLEDGRWHPVAI